MSAREQIYLSTGRAPADVATSIAAAIDGQLSLDAAAPQVLVPAAALVAGASGQFGGPVVPAELELPFRPEGEWEATDSYDTEFRLWRSGGTPALPDQDVELAAAQAIFTLLQQLDVPMIHVHTGDQLLAAYRPGHGVRTYPDGTTVYDWDAESWGAWVLPKPAS